MAFVQTRVFRVKEACNCCVLLVMSCPWDCVCRLDPQILDLNRRGHWPLTSGPGGLGGGCRMGLLICNQKTHGDRVLCGGIWPEDLKQGASVTASPRVPTTPSNQKFSLAAHSTGLFHVSPLLPVGCRKHIIHLFFWSTVTYCLNPRC